MRYSNTYGSNRFSIDDRSSNDGALPRKPAGTPPPAQEPARPRQAEAPPKPPQEPFWSYTPPAPSPAKKEKRTRSRGRFPWWALVSTLGYAISLTGFYFSFSQKNEDLKTQYIRHEKVLRDSMELENHRLKAALNLHVDRLPDINAKNTVSFNYICGAENSEDEVAHDKQNLDLADNYLSKYTHHTYFYGDGRSTLDLDTVSKDIAAHSLKSGSNVIWINMHGNATKAPLNNGTTDSVYVDNTMSNAFGAKHIAGYNFDELFPSLYGLLNKMSSLMNKKQPQNIYVMNSCKAGSAIMGVKNFKKGDLGIFLSTKDYDTWGDLGSFMAEINNQNNFQMTQAKLVQSIFNSYSYKTGKKRDIPIITYARNEPPANPTKNDGSSVSVMDMSQEAAKLCKYKTSDIEDAILVQGYTTNARQIEQLKTLSASLPKRDLRYLAQEDYSDLLFATYCYDIMHPAECPTLKAYAENNKIMDLEKYTLLQKKLSTNLN